jgi:hypothetical protein
VPYVLFEGVLYLTKGACSRGYKLRSKEGEYPKSLNVVVSCECSVTVVLDSTNV